MPSQFFGLNIAYSGLTAANAALNTTANNISNIETEGYSRQQVVQQAYDALRTFTTYGCAGAGVDTIAIERIREEFYDVKYWNNNQKLGQYEVKQYYMKQMEDYMRDEPDLGYEGFSTIFSELYNALDDILKNAGDSSVKSQFIGVAESLSSYFNNMAGNLETMQKDVNAEIKIKTQEINSLAAEIASLNNQINVIEILGQTANELRDQRAVLIDELSKIVDVEVKEVPVHDANDPNRLTGANRYIVTIAGGQTLVDTNEYKTLECVSRESYEKVNQTDAEGLYDVYWSDGSTFNLHAASLGGELRGLVDLRDGNNGEGFNGTVTGISGNVVTVTVSQAYLKDLDKCNLSGSGIINLANQDFYYDSWVYKCDNGDPPVYTVEFTLSGSELNPELANTSKIGKPASVGSSVQYQGIPYYMSQMNEWVRKFAKAFNQIATQDGAVNDYNEAGVLVFTGNKATDNDQYGFTEADLAGLVQIMSSTGDNYYKLTAKNFAVSKTVIEDSAKMATHTDEGAGQDKYDVVEQLLSVWTDKKVMNFRGSSANEFLQCMLSDVAINANSANMFYTNYSTISQSIANQRISISGVDKDDEAINLVKFQNAYDLSAKMMQILTEIYDRLILQTGV